MPLGQLDGKTHGSGLMSHRAASALTASLQLLGQGFLFHSFGCDCATHCPLRSACPSHSPAWAPGQGMQPPPGWSRAFPAEHRRLQPARPGDAAQRAAAQPGPVMDGSARRWGLCSLPGGQSSELILQTR